MQFIGGAGHYYGYLLDPWYLGKGLNQTLQMGWEDSMFRYPMLFLDCNKNTSKTLEEQADILLDKYNNYKSYMLEQKQCKNMHTSYKLVFDNKIPISKFWIAQGSD